MSAIGNKPALFQVMLGAERRQVITWTNADSVHWRIYAAPGGDGVTKPKPQQRTATGKSN